MTDISSCFLQFHIVDNFLTTITQVCTDTPCLGRYFYLERHERIMNSNFKIVDNFFKQGVLGVFQRIILIHTIHIKLKEHTNIHQFTFTHCG